MIKMRFVPLISLSWLCLGIAMTQAAEDPLPEGCSQATSATFVSSSGGDPSVTLHGCKVGKGQSTCSIPHPSGEYAAVVEINDGVGIKNNTNEVSWSVDCAPLNGGTCPDAIGIDWVNTKGSTGGTECGFVYTDDPTSDSMLYFNKSNGGFASISEVTAYTDFEEKIELITRTLPGCPPDVQAALNDDVIPGDFAIVGDISQADSLTLCLKEDAVQIIECLNVEEGDTGDLDKCKDIEIDGVSPNLVRNITFDLFKVLDTSCIYTCVPPPMTLGGRSQCGYICN